jgi:hypothetical protein
MPRTKTLPKPIPENPSAPLASPEPLSAEATLFERMATFAPEEWRTLKVYIYRLWPVIDRKEGQHFVAKVSEPFVRQWEILSPVERWPR